MKLNDYQTAARENSAHTLRADQGVEYMALALAGEAGEIANLIKKEWRAAGFGAQLTPGARHQLCLELGDALWYAANLAYSAGLRLEDIAAVNLEKLARRRRELENRP